MGGGCGGGDHMFMFVERRGGALRACVRSVRRECVEWVSSPDAGAWDTWECGVR